MEGRVRTRVLVAKIGLDGHDVGARVIARGLVDSGMEVVYTGIRRTPEQVVSAALDEDVQVIGISILSGAHLPLLNRISQAMREEGMDDVLLLVGGIIPDEDAAALEEMGVDAIFHPSSKVAEIASFIEERLGQPSAGGSQSAQ